MLSPSTPPEGAVRSRWSAEPTLREIMLLVFLSSALFAATILQFQNYRSAVTNFGDSEAYTSVASAIHHWDFRGLQIKQFWGYPYAIAVMSAITRLPEQTSLLLISCASSFISALLAYRLWGGWIAGLFALLNFDWMQRSFLGGSEPLAVALIFSAFLALRKERYLLATLLASLSTVVRPLGIFCLIGIGVVLLRRREFKKMLAAVVIGACVGALYVLPLARLFGDPLATVHSYEGAHSMLFGLPFYAIIKGTLLYPAPVTNLALSFGWILLVIAGVARMFLDPSFKAYAKQNPGEILFATPFLLLVFSYNYPVFARANFARFTIPVLPLIFLALCSYIPKDRRFLWALGVLTPILAAASALGIRNVIHMLGT
jgi:Gpi18-like mannosyltransferase